MIVAYSIIKLIAFFINDVSIAAAASSVQLPSRLIGNHTALWKLPHNIVIASLTEIYLCLLYISVFVLLCCFSLRYLKVILHAIHINFNLLKQTIIYYNQFKPVSVCIISTFVVEKFSSFFWHFLALTIVDCTISET